VYRICTRLDVHALPVYIHCEGALRSPPLCRTEPQGAPNTVTAIRRRAPACKCGRYMTCRQLYCMLMVVGGRSSGASRPASASSTTRHPPGLRPPAHPPRPCVSTAVARWATTIHASSECAEQPPAVSLRQPWCSRGELREYLASVLLKNTR
jgi:hypothetical protein